MKRIKLLLLLALAAATNLSAADIYVSPSGSDKADGSKAHPLLTIHRALRMAREWRRTADERAKTDIVIRLASGRVFEIDRPLNLRPEDSGTMHSKTIITSDGSQPAVISGGMAVKTADAALVSNGVRRISTPLTAGRPMTVRSLWQDGRKLTRSWNVKPDEMERIIDFDTDSRTITIPAASLTRHGIRTMADAPQLEMIVHQRWATAILRVADISIRGDKAILSFLEPESEAEFEHPWPQPVIGEERGSSSFALVNALQFVDEQGEWWQDYRQGTLYIKGTTPESQIVMPRLDRLVTIEGIETDRVHDIRFENVCFSHTSWDRPATMGHVTLQGGFAISEAYKLREHEGLPWATTLENQAWIERPEAAVSIKSAERVDFTGCHFRHLAATALDYVTDCRDISIENNTFEDIGGTAIMAGSFAEGQTEVHRPYMMTNAGHDCAQRRDATYTERLTIKGNTVTDATNEDWGAVGIACGFVRDVTIEANTVSHVNYSGIAIGWGWTPADTGMRNNRIIANRVTDYARRLYDAGGIYTMSAQPSSLIEGNTVSAPHHSPYATNYRAFPIYFDACTDGYTVRNNTLGTDDMLKEKYGYNTPGPDMKIEK